MDLGARHEEQLRAMLLDSDPGRPGDYGLTLVVPEIPYEHISKAMALPERRRHGGEHFYRFMMGGIYWFFVVSSHRGPVTQLQESQLSLMDDRLKMYSGGPESTQLVLEQMRTFRNAGKMSG